MIRKTIFLIALTLSFGCAAIDLQESLERGKKLVDAIPPFDATFSKTLYIETSSVNVNGCGTISLNATTVDGEIRLRYSTTGTAKFGNKLATTSMTAILDKGFHLIEWTSESTFQPGTTPAKKSSVRILDAKLQTTEEMDGKKTEKEYPLESMDFIWPAAEIVQWIKPAIGDSFAFRELDPRGEMILPKYDAQTQTFEKSPGKKYEVATWQFNVTKREDGGYQIEGRRNEYLSVVISFDSKGEMESSTSKLAAKGSPQELVQVNKVISKERYDEVKSAIEKP